MRAAPRALSTPAIDLKKFSPARDGAPRAAPALRAAIACVLLIVTAACSGAPEVAMPAPPADAAAPSRGIYVVSHGWHTGLIIPGAAMNKALPELERRFAVPAFYEIGWGDKGFYQAREITAGLALRAMFRSSGAIVHVVAVPESPQRSFPYSEISAACLSAGGFQSLLEFVAASFGKDADGHVIALAPGIYGDSQFYDGAGRYSLLNTCNTWTAKALRSAGLQISPVLKLTAASVMNALREAAVGEGCAAR